MLLLYSSVGYANLYYTPIHIPINRPFLFFIVDTELDLAIMTGRILNPLNSRVL